MTEEESSPQVPGGHSGVVVVRGESLPWTSWAPVVMGVVNASPESFSDGGRYPTLESQIAAALQLHNEGARVIDVGGESGVTGIAPLTSAAECARVIPLVTALVAEGITVSVDTWKLDVAVAALEAGAALINDVSGLGDPLIAKACGEAGAGLVMMHTRARPKYKDFPHSSVSDAVDDIVPFLAGRITEAESQGLPRSSVIIDPGPDFGKTPAQTVAVLRDLGRLQELRCPVLLAVSRKDFIGAITQTRPMDRLPGTLAAISSGLTRGAAILRVHDVAATRAYLAVRAALAGAVVLDEELRLPSDLRHQWPS